MMDELETMDTNVMVFGATNKPNSIDPAVIKRFFVRFVVENPDLEEREDMIKAQLDPCQLTKEQLQHLASLSNGLSFCAIKQIIGELYNASYLKDLQSTHLRKDESTQEYFACDPNHENAQEIFIGDLPSHSLRAKPLSYACLQERFSKTKKNSSLNSMTSELKNFHDDYCTKEFF